uniref:Translation initiation factor eIF2B subunit gamma n=1 Tax=Chlamydomonas euryale TaxID=1486919 RepID=A0A7R9VHL7_9CHLO|mmetsp:Transcript_35666/g.105393  ORF Transcript_35666/g.105393 Transcript_35666/m.105393 type:complete len:471 (+) Transcript_35666:212-1624(+)
MVVAVVLAGGEDKRLYPLVTDSVKALVPVGNVPLLHYPLRQLAEAGLRKALVVVCGEKPAAMVGAWIAQEYSNDGDTGLACEVVTVPEDCGTADALRAVAPRITSSHFIVLSEDVVTDIPVNALLASHQMHGALTTVTLVPCKTSPSSETKPGKAPKGVDYIGMDPNSEYLLYYASSTEALRDLKLPMSLVRQHGSMTIKSDLVDAHVYVFSRQLLAILESQTKLTSISHDLLPYLTQQQLRLRQTKSAIVRASSGFLSDTLAKEMADLPGGGAAVRPLPGDRYLDMSHARHLAGNGPGELGAPAGAVSGLMRVHVVDPATNYCSRVCDVRTYGEVNREVADPTTALHLTGQKPSKYDNVVSPSAVLGSKTTVAAACIVGDACELGDRSSIKRSVLGARVRLGANVKVINSVLMDGVTVGDGCTIQNSILCSGVQLKEKTSLKDCQIGAGFAVAGGVEYKGEVLAKGQPK